MEIERIADAARTKLYVYDGLPLDIITALMRLHDLSGDPPATYKVLPTSTMKYDEAYTDGDNHIIYLSQKTFDEAVKGSEHFRFTIAHEIGHIALNHRGVRSRALHGVDIRKGNIRGVLAEESGADRFAAAFLMPLKTVVKAESAALLARQCGVSLQAAQIRLNDVLRRNRKATGELRPIPQSVLANLSELSRNAGATSKVLSNVRRQEQLASKRMVEATIQGYLPYPCIHCGQHRLVRESGCVTCRACGDSDCF